MKFDTVDIGDIVFKEGYTDSESALSILRKYGTFVERLNAGGGWQYEYYEYQGAVIGVQFQTGIYVGAWICDDWELSENGRGKIGKSFNDMIQKQRSMNHGIAKVSDEDMRLWSITRDDLIEEIKSAIQCDDCRLELVDGDMFMICDIMDCDPEYYYDEYNIQQNGTEIRINVSDLAKKRLGWQFSGAMTWNTEIVKSKVKKRDVKQREKNNSPIIKSGDWIKDWVNGKVEMNSFEANGITFYLDMSSGFNSYCSEDDLIYHGKGAFVYMGLPFDEPESEEDEGIYFQIFDEDMMELNTKFVSIYEVPSFYHAIAKLEEYLRYSDIQKV